MSYESFILNPESTDFSDSAYTYTNKQQGSGYHRKFDAVHTVFYMLENFIGTVKLQGTLELYPVESDWFDIVGTEVSEDNTTIDSSGRTVNFTGNFVWIRAAYNVQTGTITEIRYNH
jgi:hypothetical protein